jgi:hypothetical protein
MSDIDGELTYVQGCYLLPLLLQSWGCLPIQKRCQLLVLVLESRGLGQQLERLSQKTHPHQALQHHCQREQGHFSSVGPLDVCEFLLPLAIIKSTQSPNPQRKRN